ncbi:MAG: putative electron transport protein YccM [Syntrophorhabdus sp. PtaU1.Bin153]|nr:MAG: putative electron transport protein YccM [Syntrophorhabdus sp. PtaU1.Bin153]
MKVTWSRLSQILFLIAFFFLFVTTEYRGKDEISVALNSFFRADPLVTVSYIFSRKAFTILLLPGLLMTLFSMVLGRFFCGWICPLGTILDFTSKHIRKVAPISVLKTRFKYYLLFTLLFAALFKVNLVGILDPIAILVRAMTFFFYPLFGYSIRSSWAGLYGLVGEYRDYLDFLYDFFRDFLLPFRETFYPLAFLSLLLFVFIIVLERYEERNWCRNLCPLGTLLGFLARLSLFRRLPARLCPDCKACKDVCPTGFDSEILQKSDCILCMECKLKCARSRVRFLLRGAGREKASSPPPVMERRVLLTGLLSGIFLSRGFSFRTPSGQERLLRPPGVNDEAEFLQKCVRCGECMKVCLRSALYPAFSQGGLHGLFMPLLIPRLGYCEYECNLCGQVCPTGAIPNLPLDRKKKSIIGLAAIDKNHCLPYAKKINCIVCEEHCPIPGKAIRFETVKEVDFYGKPVTLKRPYVLDDLCNGCGICENKCPLEGKSAIEVFSKKRGNHRGGKSPE